MVAELQNPNLFDPFTGSSILSLLPRTFKDLKTTSKNELGDMEIIHSHLKSTAIENPTKLLEQAKNILKGNPLPQNPEIPNTLPSDDKGKAIDGKAMGRPQERRPALGRKRAQFSLKPNKSQPELNDNVSLNIDQLQDPADFFSAFEKLENAKKELQKQRGDFSADVTKINLPTAARGRRPGILGKTAGYKHRYSSVLTVSDGSLSSQEIYDNDVFSQSSEIRNVEATESDEPTKENEQFSQKHMDAIKEKDSVSEAGKRVNSILDELLSTDCTELDGDGAVNFLQERLQIKRITVNKLCLPDLKNPRKSNLKASAEKSRKRRKALSDIDNNVSRVISKSSTKGPHVAENSTSRRESPTPPRSPLFSMSLLKRRMSQMVPPTDPLSFCDTDVSPGSYASPIEGRDKEKLPLDDAPTAYSDKKGLSNSRKFQSPMPEEDNNEVIDMISKNHDVDNLACPLDIPVDENPNLSNAGMDSRLSVSDIVSEGKVENMQQETVVAPEQEKLSLNGVSMGNMDDCESQLDESNSLARQDRGEDVHSQTVDALHEKNNECELQGEETHYEEVISEQQELGLEDLPLRNMDCGGTHLDESISTENEHQEDGHSQAAEILPEQNNEVSQPPSALSPKEQRKRKAPSRKRPRRTEVSPEKSLEDAGTKMELGLRRSTRIRIPPLEYWKGERFLFARVHKSHLTVLGMKYESPAKSKNGKPAFRVKSFVSDEYKDLADKIAFH